MTAQRVEEVRISEIPSPIPKDDEVLVEIAASGVNFVDLLYVSPFHSVSDWGSSCFAIHIELSRLSASHLHPAQLLCTCKVSFSFTYHFILLHFTSHSEPNISTQISQARGKHQNNRSLVTPPFTLGLEFAGTVISAPPSSVYAPGERVFGGGVGSYASQISVRPSSLHRVPNGWTFAEAAGLAATAPVSYGALVVRAGLKRGETVLVHAAAGGLGLMAVQIAKAVGARVVATAGSRQKLDVASSFGADECVDYNEPNWYEAVLKLTGGAGVDVVYDPVGLVDKSLKCLKQRGRIIVAGFAGTEGKLEKIAMNRVLLRQAQLIGYVSPISSSFPILCGLEKMLTGAAIWGNRPYRFCRDGCGLERPRAAMGERKA